MWWQGRATSAGQRWQPKDHDQRPRNCRHRLPRGPSPPGVLECKDAGGNAIRRGRTRVVVELRIVDSRFVFCGRRIREHVWALSAICIWSRIHLAATVGMPATIGCPRIGGRSIEIARTSWLKPWLAEIARRRFYAIARRVRISASAVSVSGSFLGGASHSVAQPFGHTSHSRPARSSISIGPRQKGHSSISLKVP